MKRFLRFSLALACLLAGSVASQAQNGSDQTDPRQMALDVYSGINRQLPPPTIALQLRKIIELFRYRCTRVTDYQIFAQRPNLTDIKVKCSGDPLYGVTVASNGFVSVYGGNGILSSLDRRDSSILSFEADDTLADTSEIAAQQLKEQAIARISLGSEYDYIYLIGILMMVGGVAAIMLFVWLKVWRRKQGRKPRGRMKPMEKHRVGISSDLKNQLLDESKSIEKYIHYHPGGLFIAVGKRGKRRIFLSRFWANLYANWSICFYEASKGDVERLGLVPKHNVNDTNE